MVRRECLGAVGCLLLLVFASPPAVGNRPLAVLVPHSPILIDGDAGFTPANGVSAGSGTNASPFVVSGWSIQISAGAGIEVRNTAAPFVIRDVEINGPAPGSGDPIGIRLRNVTGAAIQRVSVANAGEGLHAEGTSRLAISNSTFQARDQMPASGASIIGVTGLVHNISIVDSSFHAGYAGLVADNVSGLTVARCAFFVSLVYGVEVWSSDNVSFRENQVTTDYIGVSLVGSSLIRVEKNRIVGGRMPPAIGIFVTSVSDAVLIGNEILDAGSAGIQFQRHSLFPGRLNSPFQAYHNNFINGAVRIQFAPQDSVWDGGYPSGGNYWSGYNGSDSCRGPAQDDCSNRDGFGDSPRTWYTTDLGTVADRYPLVRAYPLPTSSPIARFDVESSGGDTSTPFLFNASKSSDARDSVSLLQFRWDWEGDGSWDTGWSSDPVDEHVFAALGDHSVLLQVRNTAGIWDTTSATVHVSPLPLGQALVSIWPIFAAAAAGGLVAVIVFLRYRKRRPRWPSKEWGAPPGSVR